MSVSLNFGEKDKKKLLNYLKQFSKIETKTYFEEFRVKIGQSTVTLYSSGKLVVQGLDEEKIKDKILGEIGLSNALILGFDEAGRGEKEGAFVVSAVLGERNKLRELRDSKKTTDFKGKYAILTKNSLAQVSFSLNSAYIDRVRKKGINLNELEAKIINSIAQFFDSIGENSKKMVDGGQINGVKNDIEFLIKGDDLEPVIGAASVSAKYLRSISGDKGKRKTWREKNEKRKD